MRAPLSIVIPTLNAADALGPTLAALMEGVEAGVVRELVMCDGGSQDDTVTLGEAAGANVVQAAPGRGGQLAHGAGATQGEWLLFLHADTQLAPGWANAVQAHMAGGDARAGYFRLRFRAKGFGARWVAGWANLRSRLLGLPYGDQGLLVSRRLYDAVGGYADIPLMEDVAIARALAGRIVAIDANALTGAERFSRGGWFRGGARNLLTLAKYFIGVSPQKLAQSYQRR